MPVSGDLFQLPDDPRLVPLPWHCRAPLGLKSGTSVHIALVESGGEIPFNCSESQAIEFVSHQNLLLRPPDLLVSVLDPREWDTTYLIESCGPDGPGLLNRLLDEIKEINARDKHVNVLIGESFTMPMRECRDPLLRFHKSSLYCQTLLGEESRNCLRELESRINQLPEVAGISGSEPVLRIHPAPLPAGAVAMHLGEAKVRHGLVETDVFWRDEARHWFYTRLKGRFGDQEAKRLVSQFDFSHACALADLDAKAIRLMFPLENSRRLLTRHADQPNVAVQATSKLSGMSHSILAGLLARLDASSGELAIVCEAIPEKHDATQKGSRSPLTDKDFESIRNRPEFRRVRVLRARSYADTLYPQLPREELLRQLGRYTAQRRDHFGQFVDELVRHIVHKKSGSNRRLPWQEDLKDTEDADSGKSDSPHPTKPSGRPTLATCVPYDFTGARCSLVREVLGAIADRHGYGPFDSLKNDDFERVSMRVVEWNRLMRLCAANIAVFVVWKQSGAMLGRHEIESIRDAFAYEQLAYNGVGLLLIESDTDEFSPDVVPITRFFSRCVTPMTFSLTKKDANSLEELIAGSSTEPPEDLLGPRSLFGRVYSWFMQQRTSRE